MKKQKCRHITILGAFSGKNKGDLAILRAELRIIIRTISEPLVIHLFSKVPAKLYNDISDLVKNKPDIQIKIHYAPTGYIGLRSFDVLARSNKIIVGGGGLFFGNKLWDVTVSHLLNLILLLPFLKIMRKKVFVYCVGISNLRNSISQKLAGMFFNFSDVVTVRDKFSAETMDNISSSNIILGADPALTLKPIESPRLKKIVSKWPAKTKIILCLHNAIFIVHKVQYPDKTLKIFCDTLCNFAKEKDITVLTYTNHVKQDYALQIAKEYPEVFKPVFKEDNYLLPGEIIALFSKADFVISSQMHPCIFAYLAKKPFLSIPYARKVDQFNNQVSNTNVLKVTDLGDTSIVRQALENLVSSQPLEFNENLYKRINKATDSLIEFINSD